MARKLVADGKAYASEGELYKSLKCFKKAYKLFPTEKIQSRIERIQVKCLIKLCIEAYFSQIVKQ